jgi:molybdopterin-containing oxidoreductase family membrane subunit
MNCVLPKKIGKFSRHWLILSLILLIPIGNGVFAYLIQLHEGLISAGMRTIGIGGAAWGLNICYYIYFAGLTFGGITTAALARLLNIEELKPITRLAELLAVFSLFMAAPCLLSDLGRPIDGALFFPQYGEARSPFFGTFTMAAIGYFFVSLVYLWLAGREDAYHCSQANLPFKWFYKLWAFGYRGTQEESECHHKVSFWLAFIIVPLLVTATSSLGVVFGIQVGRPGWFDALQAPEFVVLAGISGVGALIFLSVILRALLYAEDDPYKDAISQKSLRWLSNLLWILILIYLYFMVVDLLTSVYTSEKIEKIVTTETIFGVYSHIFWTMIGLFVLSFLILFIQFVLKHYKTALMAAAGFMVNIAAVLKRFLIVIPSQTYGTYLPYIHGHYSPTWGEYSIVTAAFAAELLLFLIFLKIFPIIPLKITGTRPSSPIKPWGKTLRTALFAGTLSFGITLAVLGFLASARIGIKPYMDPIVPWSPVIFIIGVMLSLYSPAIYEISHFT